MFFRACLLKLKVSCQFNLVEIDLAHKAPATGPASGYAVFGFC
jgi:hypothetical protein